MLRACLVGYFVLLAVVIGLAARPRAPEDLAGRAASVTVYAPSPTTRPAPTAPQRRYRAPTKLPSAPPASSAPRATSEPPAALQGLACGGDLPPCWVMMRESGGDAKVYNGGCHRPPGDSSDHPCGGKTSTASGKWQILRSTWAGYGGFLNAADAPVGVQDAKARELWSHGRGRGHWNA